MFSSFTKRLQDGLEAVENNLAAVAANAASPTAQQNGSVHPERPRTPTHAHTSSGDNNTSTSYLADGALSSLRKSFAMQRAGSPANGDPLARTRSPPPNSAPVRRDSSPSGPRRTGSTGSRLDERLRASLNKTSSNVPPRSSSPAPQTPVEPSPTRAAPNPAVPRATPSNSLPLEPANIPLPPSPQVTLYELPSEPEPTPKSSTPDTTMSDPLTPNLLASIPHSPRPIQPQSHKKNSSSVASAASPPPLRLQPTPVASSPLLPSFLPSVAAGHLEATPTPAPPAPIAAPITNDTVDAKVEEQHPTPEPPSAQPEAAEAAPAEPVVDPQPPAPIDSPAAPLETASPPLGLPPSTLSPPTLPDPPADDADRQKLLDRLSLVEQRFSDMSAAFKRLQTERAAADNVLQEHTSLRSLADADALRAYLIEVTTAASKTGDEIKQLNAQIHRQEERMQELRDTHHLEGVSRTQQADRLEAERAEAEALLKAAQELSSSSALDVTRLQGDLEKALKTAKEEEEKRMKAISLLKNVRAKGVKTEKDLEEALRERDVAREELAKEKELVKSKEDEMEKLRRESVAQIAKIRAQGEAERDALRIKLERELAGKQSLYVAETANLKSSHAEEISAHTSRFAQLESSHRSVKDERDNLFDQLQLRQAEVESSQSHLESLQVQVNELNHLLRESNDRGSSLAEELLEAQRASAETSLLSPTGSISTSQVQASTASVERRYEAKLADLRARMATIEREHTESEEEWSKNLSLRSREVERLRAELAARDGQQSVELDRNAKANEERGKLESELKRVLDEKLAMARDVAAMKASLESAKEAEVVSAFLSQNEARSDQNQVTQKFAALEAQIVELQSREGQLRTSNKTLRDELKKVQNSAALLERQRNPGVGFWAQNQSRPNVADSPTSENSRSPSRPASPAQSVTSDRAATSSRNTASAEEVNLEYLRNLILQFLEHKEMRADLVRVMSVILRFTPAETRRLVSKV